MAPDFSLQPLLVSEERGRHYVQGSMCALRETRQARARPAPCVTPIRRYGASNLFTISYLS